MLSTIFSGLTFATVVVAVFRAGKLLARFEQVEKTLEEHRLKFEQGCPFHGCPMDLHKTGAD